MVWNLQLPLLQRPFESEVEGPLLPLYLLLLVAADPGELADVPVEAAELLLQALLFRICVVLFICLMNIFIICIFFFFIICLVICLYFGITFSPSCRRSGTCSSLEPWYWVQVNCSGQVNRSLLAFTLTLVMNPRRLVALSPTHHHLWCRILPSHCRLQASEV